MSVSTIPPIRCHGGIVHIDVDYMKEHPLYRLCRSASRKFRYGLYFLALIYTASIFAGFRDPVWLFLAFASLLPLGIYLIFITTAINTVRHFMENGVIRDLYLAGWSPESSIAAIHASYSEKFIRVLGMLPVALVMTEFMDTLYLKTLIFLCIIVPPLLAAIGKSRNGFQFAIWYLSYTGGGKGARRYFWQKMRINIMVLGFAILLPVMFILGAPIVIVLVLFGFVILFFVFRDKPGQLDQNYLLELIYRKSIEQSGVRE